MPPAPHLKATWHLLGGLLEVGGRPAGGLLEDSAKCAFCSDFVLLRLHQGGSNMDSWRPRWEVQMASWRPLGRPLGDLGAVFGVLRVPGSDLEGSWRPLGTPWSDPRGLWRALGRLLEASGTLCGLSGRALVAVWEALGSFLEAAWRHVKAIEALLTISSFLLVFPRDFIDFLGAGSCSGGLRMLLEASWRPLEASWSTLEAS